jgi:hypothetical protein
MDVARGGQDGGRPKKRTGTSKYDFFKVIIALGDHDIWKQTQFFKLLLQRLLAPIAAAEQYTAEQLLRLCTAAGQGVAGG